MSERLKEIQEKFSPHEWYEGFYLNSSDIEWLMEQAEKVEQLQKTNTKLNHEIGAYSGKVRLIADKLLNLEYEMLNA